MIQETQRFALGCVDHTIVVFDLRTACRWRVFKGHTSPISALSFAPTGEVLASYAVNDGTVRLWPNGNTGFFGGVLGLQVRLQH